MTEQQISDKVIEILETEGIAYEEEQDPMYDAIWIHEDFLGVLFYSKELQFITRDSESRLQYTSITQVVHGDRDIEIFLHDGNSIWISLQE